MLTALSGAVVLAVLSTFYDFVWAHFEVRHKAINGVVHGMTLLSVAGLVLAWPVRRWLGGLLGGALTGLIGAASFYAAYPMLGYLNALVAAWMVMWIAFGTLATQLRRERVGTATAIRGPCRGRSVRCRVLPRVWHVDRPQRAQLPQEFRLLDVCLLPGLCGVVVEAPEVRVRPASFAGLKACATLHQRLNLLQMIDVVARVQLDQVRDGLRTPLGVQAVMRVS